MLAIVDYGIGNVRSVQNAFSYLGIDTVLTREAELIDMADGLILPGVGAFGEGIKRIGDHGLAAVIQRYVDNGRPILGICLGFQLLMNSSDELGLHEGLAFLPFPVRRLPSQARLPHIGWAAVATAGHAPKRSALLEGGLEGEHFYFVHSHGVSPVPPQITCAIAHYGGCDLVALVEHGNVYGTQFHPEKSGEAGLHLLHNFYQLTQ